MLKQVQHDDSANGRNVVVSGTAAFGSFGVEGRRQMFPDDLHFCCELSFQWYEAANMLATAIGSARASKNAPIFGRNINL